MTKLAKSKFVQNKKVLKCADSRQQRATVLRVTVCKSDSSSRKEKKKRFEYISLWQAIRSLLSKQYSLGFSQGQNGLYFGLFFWREQGIFGVIWLYCLHAGIGLAVLAVSALKKCPFLLLGCVLEQTPITIERIPFYFFFALSLGHNGEIEILNSNLNCTTSCSFQEASFAHLVSFKIVVLFVSICIESTTILKEMWFPQLAP